MSTPGPLEAERTQAAPAGGFTFWFAVLGGIVLWLTHLFIVSSLVQLTCNTHGRTEWVEHAATVVTAALTGLALWLCLRYLRDAGDDEAAGTPWGRTRFLALFGSISNAANLLLILAEGAYVFAIRPACG
ncbi:MAG TPA: hypothetical protein VFA83_04450 [Acidimicrobiales bacterium]|nr:hypothetical protein [Acidimicrobiales bacterium]